MNERGWYTIAYLAQNAICDRIEGLIREMHSFSRAEQFSFISAKTVFKKQINP